MAWQRGNIAYSSESLPDWRDAVGRSLRKHNKQTDVPSTPPGLEGNWPHLGRRSLPSQYGEVHEKEIGMTAFGGSCLCGGVKFEITGPL